MEVIKKVKIPKNCSADKILVAVEILIAKPNSIDKKLAGALLYDTKELITKVENLDLRKSCKIWRKLVPRSCTQPSDCQIEEIAWEANWEKENFTLRIENFELQMDDNKFELHIRTNAMNPIEKARAEAYLSALTKWCNEKELEKKPPSLRLVQLDAYQIKYNQLKTKYSRSLIEVT